MKQVVDWDEDYVLNLPQGEHDWLEFKSSRLLDFSLPAVNQNTVLDELSKQISAFANSGGGTIVYGIQDTPIGTPRSVDADGGVSLNLKNGTKEWLEDVIPNLVDFPVSLFNVYVLTASASGIHTGKGVFLINIPSSEAAPHQAGDKKYYARVGGKSRPIGHRLVMDIVGRAQYPKLEISCRIVPKEERPNYDNSRDALRVFCQNIGKIYANYVSGYFYIPITISRRGGENIFTIGDKQYSKIWFDNTHEDVVGYRDGGGLYGSRALTISRYDPVLPKLGFRAGMIDLTVSKDDLVNFAEEIIFWEIYADNAPEEKGIIKIGDLL
jgi:Putative DNA-binding domain